MKVIARPVGTGKTRELIETAAKENGIVLTVNRAALRTKAIAYGYPDVEIIEMGDMIYGNFSPNKKVFVHKMDDFVQDFLWHEYGLELSGYSVALEDSNNAK